MSPVREPGGFKPNKLYLALAVWLTVVLAFYWYAESFALTPSKKSSLTQFPAKINLSLDPQHPTLFVFIHPQCPCSRTTVDELSEILVRHKNVRAYAIIAKPAGTSSEFVRGALVDSVRGIDGLDVIIDENDRIAHHFGAFTSGQVMLFNKTGRCLFNGGITLARGHAGDNVGANSVRSLLSADMTGRSPENEHTIVSHNSVFGCSLEGEQ